MTAPTVGLVACGSRKRPTASPARSLYTGQHFAATARYAASHCDEWAILSAKHGLLLPDQVVEPYNVKLGDLPAAARRSWAARTARQLRDRWPDPDTRFVVLAGRPYRQALAGRLAWCPWDGLRDARMGFQRQWLMKNQDRPLVWPHDTRRVGAR